MTTLYLYELPRNTIVHLRPPQAISDGSTWFEFRHIDDMYSLCITEKGEPLHLSATTEIERDGEGYWLG